MQPTHSLVALTCLAASAIAQTFPLPASADDRTQLESTAPFLLPLRCTETKVVDRAIATAHGMPNSLTQWDQIAFDPSSRYLFWTAEQTLGAAVIRLDTQTGACVTLLFGNGSGVRNGDPAAWSASNDDFRNLDPCRFTAWGTLVTGEEADGGRLFEVMNPLATSGPFDVRWRSKVPAATHEGLIFAADGTMYFSDEDNSGSIYKFVPTSYGDLANGQTFVLSVDAFHDDPTALPDYNWDSSQNRHAVRLGTAHWLPITDANGNALTTANPFAFVTATGGRLAGDELRATPYGRCEDMDIGRLANGHTVLYSSLTNENRILSIELVSATVAIVREFVNYDTVDLATGADVNPLQADPYTLPGAGTVFDFPDNLAVDAFGSVYIVEDNLPGDIWKAIDADGNGVAESIGLFASLGVAGSEPSGLIFDPNDPYRCVCNVLGPASGNSAMWSFRTRPYAGSGQDLLLRTGSGAATSAGPAQFVETIAGGQLATLALSSPGGAFAQAPFAVLFQLWPTAVGPTPLLPTLWLNPLDPMAVASGGGGQLLPTTGSSVSVFVPPGLGGLSAMVQGVAVGPAGLVFSDGHEVVLQ